MNKTDQLIQIDKNPNDSSASPSIAVTIPCYNEQLTILKVIEDFRKQLPNANIYVFDNNSTDNSRIIAKDAGVEVISVLKQGKGFVVQSIFKNIKEDLVIMVDGDDTYFSEDIHNLLEPVLQGKADMVVGNRLLSVSDHSMNWLHQFGNKWIVQIINWVFGTSLQDILSGYRVFNRRFIQEVPLLTGGFEIEMEMTLQAVERDFDILEIPVHYRNRPPGSQSKLRAFNDGYRIMLLGVVIFRDHHPLRYFGIIGGAFFAITLISAIFRLMGYFGVQTFPKELLTGLMLLCLPVSFISIGTGLSLNLINVRLKELLQIMNRSN